MATCSKTLHAVEAVPGGNPSPTESMRRGLYFANFRRTMKSLCPTAVVALEAGSRGIAEALRSNGMRVLEARSGVEVVDHLFPRGGSYAEPALIVLSARLPGYNGLSVLAGVRSFGWQTPIIMTWAEDMEWMALEAVRLGVASLVREPATTAGLFAAVQSLPRVGLWCRTLEQSAEGAKHSGLA